jgi:hypothetical protein
MGRTGKKSALINLPNCQIVKLSKLFKTTTDEVFNLSIFVLQHIFFTSACKVAKCGFGWLKRGQSNCCAGFCMGFLGGGERGSQGYVLYECKWGGGTVILTFKNGSFIAEGNLALPCQFVK